MTKPRLQIVRGLPGSGKSTYARNQWPNLLRLEFDQFCMCGGEYAWGEKRNSEGQAWLRAMIGSACASGFDFVVCGVFAGRSENLRSIVAMAVGAGYDVFIRTLGSDYGNCHGVRPQDYANMKDKFISDQDMTSGGLLPESVAFGDMPTLYKVSPMADGK